MKTDFGQYFILFVTGLAVTVLLPSLSLAQEISEPDPARFDSGADVFRAAASGNLGGPTSAGAQLVENRGIRQFDSRNPGLDAAFQPAEDVLERLRLETGLDLGFDYQAVWQGAHDHFNGTTQASAGQARIIGKWELVGRGTENQGSLVFIVEKRHKLWNELTPAELGGAVGYAGVTGTAFGDSGAHVSVLYWEQALAEGRAGLVAGRIDPSDYTDVLGYANQRTTFLNFSTLLNSTIALPDPGFGFGAGGFITDQLYAIGVVSDANGSLTDIEWFRGGHEYYTYGEIGWTPSRAERYLTNIHVGAWHVDERVDLGIDSSYGFVASANVTIDDVLMPFVRFGMSQGTAPLANTALTGGFIYYFPGSKDLMGFAAAWNDPSAAGLGSQTTLETFYRYQLSDNIAITADAQYLINPAAHPTGNNITVFGLRARFSL